MKKSLLSLLLSIMFSGFFGQNKFTYLKYTFSSDSLEGFDEAGYSTRAMEGGFFGSEYRIFMYRAKREFINKKYGIAAQVQYSQKNGDPVVAAAPCVNEDFESSPTGSVISVTGWTITEGQNASVNGSCSMTGCCLAAASGTNTWIRTTPFVAPAPLSYTVPNSPLGGSQVIQLNDENPNIGEVVRLEQVIPVTSSNSLLQYAYMGAFNGSGHICCENPYLNILLYDNLNNLIAPGSTSVVVPGASCTSTTTGFTVGGSSGESYFTAWQVVSVNLSAYIGSNVRLQVTVGDCNGWAHYGYAYFDAKCSGSTGITENIKEQQLLIFPNPNSGEFTIKGKEEDTVIITDEIGRTMRSFKLEPSNGYSILVRDLSQGIYFVQTRNSRQKIAVIK